MVRISQASIDEVGRVSAAVAAAERGPNRTFDLTISLDSEAFGDDQWDREMEVSRILRHLSMTLGTSVEAMSAELRDRNGKTVGKYTFKQN